MVTPATISRLRRERSDVADLARQNGEQDGEDNEEQDHADADEKSLQNRAKLGNSIRLVKNVL